MPCRNNFKPLGNGRYKTNDHSVGPQRLSESYPCMSGYLFLKAKLYQRATNMKQAYVFAVCVLSLHSYLKRAQSHIHAIFLTLRGTYTQQKCRG